MPPCAPMGDEAAWPLSTRGYARLRGAIPRIMYA